MQKIVFLNHSDARGGASVVTMRLIEALCDMGVDARMIVMHKAGASERVALAEPAWRRKAAFLAEHADIYLHNGLNRADLFKISTARFGMPLSRHPWVREADAICLAWINQGLLSLREIERICALGKPVLWTMHDMWPMTGGCHHAGECQRYTRECGNCPLISEGRGEHDLTWHVHSAKQKMLAKCPDIHFLPVSNWLADCARRSSLLKDTKISVLANAFPTHKFFVTPRTPRADLGLPEGRKLVVMGAARLDDPIKNLPLAVDTLNRVGEAHPDVTAVFYGNLRDAHALDGLRMPYVHLGAINTALVPEIMSHADVVLSTSHYETLPGTLIEGLASGAMAVSTANGGQADIITDGVNGYLCNAQANDLASAIGKCLAAPADRKTLHDDVAARFDAAAIARKFMQLC